MGQYSDLRLEKGAEAFQHAFLRCKMPAMILHLQKLLRKRTLLILEEVLFSTSLQVPVENPDPMMPMLSMLQESAEFLTTIRFASRQLSLVRLM